MHQGRRYNRFAVRRLGLSHSAICKSWQWYITYGNVTHCNFKVGIWSELMPKTYAKEFINFRSGNIFFRRPQTLGSVYELFIVVCIRKILINPVKSPLKMHTFYKRIGSNIKQLKTVTLTKITGPKNTDDNLMLIFSCKVKMKFHGNF